MERLDYLLTIRIPIKAVDNIDARIKGRCIVKKIFAIEEMAESGAKHKFQLLHKDKNPTAVDLLLKTTE